MLSAPSLENSTSPGGFRQAIISGGEGVCFKDIYVLGIYWSVGNGFTLHWVILLLIHNYWSILVDEGRSLSIERSHKFLGIRLHMAAF